MNDVRDSRDAIEDYAAFGIGPTGWEVTPGPLVNGKDFSLTWLKA